MTPSSVECGPFVGMRDSMVSEREAVLRERRAYATAMHAYSLFGRPECERQAVKAYPLPKKTVARVVADPSSYQSWRAVDGVLEFSTSVATGKWRQFDGKSADYGRASIWFPTPERVRVWADLLANPTTEVEDDGTEGES